jgi:hypothetical protein
MKNAAHAQATFYLIFETVLEEQEFRNKVNADTIVGSMVEITLPNGQTCKAAFTDMVGLEIVEFIDDEEEATKQIV